MPVEGGRLVRVLAVPQAAGALPGRPRERREAGPVGGVGEHAARPRGHGDVVRGGVREGPRGEHPALLEREAAGADGVQHRAVGRGVDDDRDARVVLRRRPDHGGPADVDLLDDLGRRGAGQHRLPERVEVGDEQVERLDAELAERPRECAGWPGRPAGRRGSAGAAS